MNNLKQSIESEVEKLCDSSTMNDDDTFHNTAFTLGELRSALERVAREATEKEQDRIAGLQLALAESVETALRNAEKLANEMCHSKVDRAKTND